MVHPHVCLCLDTLPRWYVGVGHDESDIDAVGEVRMDPLLFALEGDEEGRLQAVRLRGRGRGTCGAGAERETKKRGLATKSQFGRIS